MTRVINARKRNIFPFAVFSATSLLALAFILPYQASAAMLTQQLDLGESNADVTSLQVFLAANTTIYPEGIVSGYYGPLTAAAVSRFQTANGLSAVGRVGPATLAAINAQMGNSVPTSGSDVNAPTISPETLSVVSNAATASWTASESSVSRVMYGTSWPFLYATAPSVRTNGFSTTAGISITGLQPATTYYYVRESVDGSNNVMWTVAKSFRTQ